jgi:RNA polymerase sigma-70 factor (ECF subfamily)
MTGPIRTEGRERRMQDLDLESVVRLAGLGESDAFAELYRRFAQRVLGICRQMLGSREAAEDATSEVFMRLPHSIATYDGSVPFEHWFVRVSSNHCVDLLRRRQLQQRWIVDANADALPAVSSWPTPLAVAITAETSAQVRQAVECLPAQYRAVLMLRYYSGLSYDEIAQQLGLKKAHVATLIFRAKQELRQALVAQRGKP